MILFESDWDKYPNAVVHKSTKNQSFLKMAKLYKEMGVKNFRFPLQLHNRELMNVDPYNPNLSREEVAMITQECTENFYYFIREVARVPARSTTIPPPFVASRGNMALYWLFHNHIMQFLIMVRQTGKSVSTEVLHTWLSNLGCVGTEINIVTQNDSSRSKVMERLKEIESSLPPFLRMRKPSEPANSEIIQISEVNNSIKCHISSASEAIAYKVGRGFTSAVFHGDEVVYIPNVEIAITSALAAGTTARVLAEKNNQPYGTIFTTTAGKKDSREGKYVFNLMSEAATWTEKFLDAKDRQHLEEMILSNARAAGKKKGYVMVNTTLNHRQLGYTDAWLEKAIKDSLQTGEDCERDYFNKWTSGTASSPLNPAEADRIRKSERETVFMEISPIDSYTIRWYKTEEELLQLSRTSYWILGVDPSDASGGDDIGLTITDSRTGEVVGVGNYNLSNIITLCQFFVSLLEKYPKTLMIVERRSSGQTILDYLLLFLPTKGIDPFRRLYNTVVQKAAEDKETFEEIMTPMYARPQDIYTRYKKSFGFATSASGTTARSELYGTTLQKLVKYTGDFIKDKKLIDQLLALVRRNGRVDHEIGEHDDLVVSWLLTGWLMFHGRNMNFYGLEHSDILSANRNNKEDNSPKNIYERALIEKTRAELADVLKSLESERNPVAMLKLESRLRNLMGSLPVAEQDDSVNVDAVLTNIEEERARQSRNMSSKSKYFR